jgi:agmatine deiminase
VNDESDQRRALNMLRRQGSNAARLHFHCWRTDRVWLRDSGPIFVKIGNAVAVTNWKFNAWAKYDNWRNDDLIPKQVAKLHGMKIFEPSITQSDGKSKRLVLEGGSIDTNGEGVLLKSACSAMFNSAIRASAASSWRKPLPNISALKG